MGRLDMNWVKTQLEAARVRKGVGDATIKLIEQFDEMQLTDLQREKVVEMFSTLALGHAFVEDNKNEVWVPVRPGDIRVTETVRVKSNAFSGDLGVLHNGRRGVVVGVRYGDVIIRSTDAREPALDGSHYPPDKLEKLVQG